MAENENKNKNASIVFISSIFRDLVAVSDKFPRCSQCKTVFIACCRPGETIFGSEFRMGFGGKGANQCVMAARLGAATTIVAKVETNAVQNYSDFGLCKSENLHQVRLLTFVDLHCRSVEMSTAWPTRPTFLSRT